MEKLEAGGGDILEYELVVDLDDALPQVADQSPRTNADCQENQSHHWVHESFGFKVRGHPGEYEEADCVGDHPDHGRVLKRWIGTGERQLVKTDEKDLRQKH